MTDWIINVGFRSNAQSLETVQRKIRAGGLGFARMLVDDVAYTTAETAATTARRTLSTSIARVVNSEISRMATQIGKFLALPDKYAGPNGVMSIKGRMSETARNLWGRNELFDRKSTGIKWAKRTDKYLRWKRRSGWPARWWELTGSLSESLSNPAFYAENFGPVRVTFRRTLPAHKPERITLSGQSARPSMVYDVGQVRVSFLNRITPQDLPSLLSGNPRDAQPSNSLGVARLISDPEVGGKLRTTARGQRVRYALEPFLSFYMARAIPDAVWRRTERLLENPGFTRRAGSGFSGTEDFSQV